KMIIVWYKPKSVTNRTVIVMIISVLKYVPPELFTPFCVKTCSHNNVAKEPIGVILGPKSEAMTFAYSMPYFNIPVALDWPLAIASIKPVGMLFIIEDKKAAIKPIPMMLLNNP